MKKTLSIILILTLLLGNISVISFANSYDENLLDYSVEKISKVNDLSKSNEELIRQHLKQKIFSLSKTEKKALFKEMKSLEKSYKIYKQKNTEFASLNSKISQADSNLNTSRGDYILILSYVGNVLATNDIMLLCDQGGYEIISDIVTIGGGLGTVGAGIIAYSTSSIATGGVAAIIGGACTVGLGVLRLQLRFNDTAILLI